MLLSVTSLVAGYESTHALRAVSLHIDRGEAIAVIGPKNSGKSALLESICGRRLPDSGCVTFNGQEITGTPPEKLADAGIAYVSCENIRMNANVLDNLTPRSWLARFSKKSTVSEALEKVYSVFPILAKKSAETASSLSIVEKRMLSVGIALTAKPTLILIDSAIDDLPDHDAHDFSCRLASLNMSVIVTGSDTIFLNFAQRGYVMDDGRVLLTGVGTTLASNPEVQRICSKT